MKGLSINSHTGFHWMLSKVEFDLDIVGWDFDERPLPSNINLITWEEMISNFLKKKYDFIILHRPIDLKILKYVMKRKSRVIYVFHGRFERTGFKKSLSKKLLKRGLKQTLKLLKKIGVINEFVFISHGVKVSWGLDGYTICPGVDLNDFWESDYSKNRLLIVGNNLHRHYFAFELLLETMTRFPLNIIGENPYIPIAKKARNFEELKFHYASHRAFIYLAREPEEGFNLSLLEAMASALPIVTLFHSSSPVRHMYNGLVAYNKKEFFEYCDLLLNDKDLAKTLGKNARKTVQKFFSIEDFKTKWKNLILNKWEFK